MTNMTVLMIIFYCVFRNAARLELTSEQLDQELRGSLSWNSAAISVLTHAWKEQVRFIHYLENKQMASKGSLSKHSLCYAAEM